MRTREEIMVELYSAELSLAECLTNMQADIYTQVIHALNNELKTLELKEDTGGT